MSQVTSSDKNPEADADDDPTTDVEPWLENMSRQLDPMEYDHLFELGIYSIHDHSTARTITLPEAASEFEDAATVKQYYYESERCPLLIVTPLRI